MFKRKQKKTANKKIVGMSMGAVAALLGAVTFRKRSK